MKFDYVIGNPPYQEEINKNSDNKSYAAPVYHEFIEASYKVADKVELIHPARFLFNAGSTPKQWNKKMLHDKHLKILTFESIGKNIFPNTSIKGGIAVSYHDITKDFGEIEVYTPYKELNSILKKVKPKITHGTMDSIITGRGIYQLSKDALDDYPEIVSLQSKGHQYDVGSGAFRILKNIIFFEEKPNDGQEYVRFLGLFNKKRIFYWTLEKYHRVPKSFYHYKVFIPKANGTGAIGEVLSTPLIGEPLIGEPLIGATETFLSIGDFQTRQESENCLKYIKSKFARVMLGILKVTQNNAKPTWKYVPLQDFTSNSDIDWSKPIHEIDLQLYRKYGLSQEEIDFIESHVKEMD